MTQELTRERIAEEVKKMILREFLPGEDPAELTESTPLITGGILDSITTLKLVDFLEGRYGIEFEAHEVDADHLDTIEQVSRLVRSKRSDT